MEYITRIKEERSAYAQIVRDNTDYESLIQMSGTVLAAQYFNVLSWCWEQITRDRKERIMLIADECWTMIDPRCPQSPEKR